MLRVVAGCALAVLLLGLPARAQWKTEEIGRTAVVRMRSAPFPHPSRPQYTDDRVLMFVPAALNNSGTAVDVIVHYHGHRAETASDAERRLLRQQLADSRRAAVLLCPQGPLRASDSAGGKHEQEGGLRRFIDEAFQRMIADGVLPAGARPGHVVLSGHSGGYKVIAADLARGGVNVDEVWLHDGLYGNMDVFRRWANRPGRRLVSTHTPGGGTRGNNLELARQLRQDGVPVVGEFSARAMTGARAVILAVPEGHHDVTHRPRRFQAFLNSSVLRDSTSHLREAAAAPPTRNEAARSEGLVNALGGPR